MSDLFVLAVDNEQEVQRLMGTVQRLQKENLLQLDDAATVVRKPDGKVKVKQANDLVGAGAVGGAFWGMLIGLLFFVPWLGLAVGALTGALSGKFTDIGIDDNFIKEVGATVQPGNAALFMLVRSATADRVIETIKTEVPSAKLIKTSLSAEAEAKLKETFGAEHANA